MKPERLQAPGYVAEDEPLLDQAEAETADAIAVEIAVSRARVRSV